MNVYSKKSFAQLCTAEQNLRHLFTSILPFYDHTIIEGHREKEAQNRAVEEGRSKLSWPNGKHNADPSRAVDVSPHPVEWPTVALPVEENERRIRRFYHFGGFVEGFAAAIGTSVRWGGDWDQDRDLFDQKFNDLVHFELGRIRETI